ncbi:MADS-box transcription factor 51-like [Papaver somniferum]|uniref:MADS-box transcription factor 51-like n=1 Tax=Papaver somniferum TaxID=3469 RepID=UPI000E6FE315|nr:MADS-box transcription factor 51-like [Papaver somniferum]
MGKRRIEMKKIEDRQKRNVCFTKRRHGLFNKAADLCRLTGADISLLVISPGGNPYTFSSSSISWNDLNSRLKNTINFKEVKVADDERTRVSDDGFWWNNLNPEEIDSIEKLTAVRNQLLDVKEKVAQRKQELLAAAEPIATSTTTSTCTVGEMEEDSSLLEDDLEKLLSDAYDDAPNWLPSIDDSRMLFEGLDYDESWLPLGIDTVLVLVGPAILLLLKPAKDAEKSFSCLSLLGSILPYK